MSGRRWLSQRSRHCLPVRPTSCDAMRLHFFCPWSSTSFTRASSSTVTQGREPLLPAAPTDCCTAMRAFSVAAAAASAMEEGLSGGPSWTLRMCAVAMPWSPSPPIPLAIDVRPAIPLRVRASSCEGPDGRLPLFLLSMSATTTSAMEGPVRPFSSRGSACLPGVVGHALAATSTRSINNDRCDLGIEASSPSPFPPSPRLVLGRLAIAGTMLGPASPSAPSRLRPRTIVALVQAGVPGGYRRDRKPAQGGIKSRLRRAG
mmetsp:Transcript_62752/g.198717  ORF Transcript_62752/g.198717 Transcript_62752/m.198717 type:complete len:260 (+) Transcript_62752:257-1036(+)